MKVFSGSIGQTKIKYFNTYPMRCIIFEFLLWRRFLGWPGVLYKIWPHEWFFVQRASYHFNDYECTNLRVLIFVNYWRTKCLKGRCKCDFYWYYLKVFKSLNSLIGFTNSDHLIIINFRNSKFGLKRQFSQ